MTAPMLLTETEAATRLGISDRTLRRERQAGHINYILIGRRILYDLSDIQAFIDRARITPESTATPRPIARGRRGKANRPGADIIPFSQRQNRGT